jgi:predicted anti-sigma-YlaC factor YlaD
VSLLLALSASCSVEQYAINRLGDALAGGGTSFASDDDVELIREAVPFSLKMIESLLAQSPRHEGLLLAATRGFTQYSYAFIQQDAERMEDVDLQRSLEIRTRARKLYLRARDYGLRGLSLERPYFVSQLRTNPVQAAATAEVRDVAFLYWTAAAWGAAISISKDDPDLVADQPQVEALIDRALELDDEFGYGAIHSFLIAYEGSRKNADAGTDALARSRRHFERAVAESDGVLAAPYVTLAESVSIQTQNRGEFVSLLERSLAIDVNARPEWRLENLILQQRARWLLGRVDELFVE